MEKLKFEFVVKAGEDPKTNVCCMTSITNADKNIFLIPEKLQPVRLHEMIIKTPAYEKVKLTLQRRHDKRQVWISMTPEQLEVYMDEDGNMQFQGYLLEEITVRPQLQASAAGISEEALAKILENFADKKKDIFKHQNVKKQTERMVLDKFTNKTTNASQWLTTFETECRRVGIEEDIPKIEALRLFLEDSCLDWYRSMIIKFTVDSEWSQWKKMFCETYADKGWSPVRYAMFFRYRQGSLLEYAIKKERLLLEINKRMDKSTLIDLIAIGLPIFVADRLDREDLKETEDLFNSLRGLEHLVSKKIRLKRRMERTIIHAEFVKKKIKETGIIPNPYVGLKIRIMTDQNGSK
ncbi:uncharacterized protein LOC133515838 [Cydia pomonella]|uniref:uncharacterized protein LOC133515838 n=1 Tax=Cydia pomonella TaxID=82600 RepID=UPI002ADE9343|nr:uncharacterized protein LOC133515838 [Cydia pomonella]